MVVLGQLFEQLFFEAFTEAGMDIHDHQQCVRNRSIRTFSRAVCTLPACASRA